MSRYLIALILVANVWSHQSDELLSSCSESTLDSFLSAYKSNNIIAMRSTARCAIDLRFALIDISENVNGFAENFGFAVVRKILVDNDQLAANGEDEQDVVLLRHMLHHSVKFHLSSIRIAILSIHIPMIKFFIHEAGVLPSPTDFTAWQPVHAAYFLFGEVQKFVKQLLTTRVTKVTKIRIKKLSSTMRALIKHSPIFLQLFQDDHSSVPDSVLRLGMNEVTHTILDILFQKSEFVDAVLLWNPVSLSKRTLLHVAAENGDLRTCNRVLDWLRNKCKKMPQKCSHLMTVEAVDTFGLTAFDLATRSRFPEVAVLLANATTINTDHVNNIVAFATKIDRIHVENINASIFWNEYVLRKRPLLIKQGCRSWKAYKRWTIRYLDKHLQMDQMSNVSFIPYANEFGINTVKLANIRALHGTNEDKKNKCGTNEDKKNKTCNVRIIPPMYLFDQQILKTSRRLMSEFPSVPHFARPPGDLEHALATFPAPTQLYIGNTGSGSPFHFHSDAINANFRGSTKQYRLLPPNCGFYSVVPPVHWTADSNSKKCNDQMISFQQRPGDVVFIPSGFSHSVINDGPVIGVATEMMSRHTNMWTGRWN